jgi:hypothetical protein
MSETLPPLPETPFWRAYQGRFAGFPTWAMHDRFWPVLTASTGDWFAFEPEGGSLPDAPLDAAGLAALLAEAEAMFAPARDRSFAGIVFADDVERPSFVKIFDPWKMGASCGSSGERILPRWVLSRMRPDSALPVAAPEPAKPGLMQRLGWRG